MCGLEIHYVKRPTGVNDSALPDNIPRLYNFYDLPYLVHLIDGDDNIVVLFRREEDEFFEIYTCYVGVVTNFPCSGMQRGLDGKSSRTMQVKDEEEGSEEEVEDEHGETLGGACGDNYASDEFWICCDMCEKWFHGKCVKITPARAEHIKHYKCPSCSNKRARSNFV
ncbi:unnamed protein product [Thlaspi arvense]|uniref:PHD finger protein ALFIN-LIKE n=1 Tax=Thlaspi arvense TaxID=13288 RepID=A0AAU9ST50_THLAR|nr:unnamed protein product [Thlaspi arvense]